MNYILITEKLNLNFNNVTNLQSKDLKYALKQFSTVDSIAIDIETTGLNPWEDKILLIALYNNTFNWVLVIDATTIDISPLKELLETKLILAANTQFEYSFLSRKNIYIKRTFDTMVTELKLLQGSPYSVSLLNTLERRGIPLPEGMDKDVRMEFVEDNFELKQHHVIYNAADVLPLYALKEAQEDNIKTFKLNFFINSIHNPLALILAKIKMEGFCFNKEKWDANADNIEEVCNQLVSYLNDKVMPLIDWQSINSDVAKEKERKEKGIATITIRIAKLKANLSLMKTKGKTHLKSFVKGLKSLEKAELALIDYSMIEFTNRIGINWSSSKQVLETLTELGVTPLPQAKSTTTHKIQPSVSASAREAWLLENTDHKWFEIIDIFHNYKSKSHNVKSFGRAWTEKYLNPITNKVHTSFRQNAATGRLTSGNADEGLFNSQQIPANNDFRHCFGVEEGYLVATIDYSGAELCFMAVTAEDDRLIELSKGHDMHSHFANKGWKAIYTSRGIEWNESNYISKYTHKDQRTAYKPMMFGVVYGLRAKKAAETLNITVKEGQIAIDTIVKEIPKTIKMVEEASAFALVNGYVIHNSRTNSRRWFNDVLASNQLGTDLPFMVRSNVESTARNTRIQGSQSDCILESIVWISRWISIFKIDAIILGTVHDEVIIKFKAEQLWIAHRIKDIMERVASLYMKGMLELKADLEIRKTWTK